MSNAPVLKPAVPFGPVDQENGWEQVPGGAQGVEQKMLSGELDEDAKSWCAHEADPISARYSGCKRIPT